MTGEKITVNWEGSLFVHHSLGMVNREILRATAPDAEIDIRNIPWEPACFSCDADPRFAPLKPALREPHDYPAVQVRHRWPPELSRPPAAAFVLFQPWEYGSLPSEWVEKIPRSVEELWVYSTYLRECCIASGIAPEKIRVIPLGVDPAMFRPEAVPSAEVRRAADDRFCFFFNGGLTLRKGIDILVNAYLSEFGAHEKVRLIIKGSPAYKPGLSEKIAALVGRRDLASIVILNGTVPPADLPGLYTAIDCYVHPCRAEGYGLPIAEAMACGKPVITTGAGAQRDFADETTAYLIKCSIEKLPGCSVDGIATVSNPFWILPDTDDLRRLMRYVFENRAEAAERGLSASEHIRLRHTWRQTAAAVKDGLRKLCAAR